ncbi:unnamed protein product [Thlaspi arvense]|uniref:Defensin-like domain-containing protein n=1 Tax=Thlaspi arvense TaxID=13288 RepID=A0AAU9RD91_THLAR|nr:unnamed protein product [Thlaspi arvense]
MVIKKTSIFFLIVILTILLSNSNILASGVEINNVKYTCGKMLCTDRYTLYMCMTDCGGKGFAMGACLSPTPNAPKRCCCNPYS